MKPRKTPPTEGLAGIAMHVLFDFFLFISGLCCLFSAVEQESMSLLLAWLCLHSWCDYRLRFRKIGNDVDGLNNQ